MILCSCGVCAISFVGPLHLKREILVLVDIILLLSYVLPPGNENSLVLDTVCTKIMIPEQRSLEDWQMKSFQLLAGIPLLRCLFILWFPSYVLSVYYIFLKLDIHTYDEGFGRGL